MIYCNEESSTKSETWMITKWFNKGRDFLFGKEYCVCCCPTQDKNISDIAVRDVPSNNDNKSACKKCVEVAKEAGDCLHASGCVCGLIFKEFGKAIRDLVMGCIGLAATDCQQAWRKRRCRRT